MMAVMTMKVIMMSMMSVVDSMDFLMADSVTMVMVVIMMAMVMNMIMIAMVMMMWDSMVMRSLMMDHGVETVTN